MGRFGSRQLLLLLNGGGDDIDGGDDDNDIDGGDDAVGVCLQLELEFRKGIQLLDYSCWTQAAGPDRPFSESYLKLSMRKQDMRKTRLLRNFDFLFIVYLSSTAGIL